MTQFNTIADVQEAVKAGHKVHWKNECYVVTVDMFGQWHIAYMPWSKNPNYVSLFWDDGVRCDYNPEHFFIAQEC